MNMFDKTTDVLAASLRMRQVRHNVTSANIANAETPHYHAKKVDFENALASALETDSITGDHFGQSAVKSLNAEVYENPDIAMNNDGNTVDLEKEMSALSENSIMYKSALQLINKKMAALKYALGER